MKVITGFGYLTNSEGNITDKYLLPAGDHPLKDGYTQTEVADQAALDLVELYQEPMTEDQALEILIDKKKRDIALDALKTEGAVNASGKITEAGKTEAAALTITKGMEPL